MKKVLISILCMSIIFLGVGCSQKKSYNTTSCDDASANTDDIRTLTGDTFNSSFELVSYEDIDSVTSLYVVRDKTTKKEYIIAKCGYGISIIERTR